MSLIDPTNPSRWADGSERSCNNAFTQTMDGTAIDWKPLQRRANLSSIGSKTVQRRRDDGEMVGSLASMGRRGHAGTMHGLSKKADERIAAMGPNRLAMVTIENAEAGRVSREKRARLRRGSI